MIAAALSIQDPRERPAEERAQADQLHARFADESSDFLAYLNLWRYLREQQRELSGNQFRKRCRAEFLHYLRIREWQDLVAQLRRRPRSVGVTLNREPAEPRRRSTSALLAGLLSHVGLRDAARREYEGARGARFAIFPGSALARKPPTWVMVAELVETSRLWGRTAARIEPRVDRAAGRAPGQAHLLRAALGRAARRGRRHRARDALRAADRRRAHGRLRADRPGALARAVHPPRAGRGRLGDPARVRGRATARCSRRSRRSRSARAGATCSPATRRCSTSSTSGSRPTSSPARTSTAGGATSAARPRAARPTRASCSIAGRRRRARPAGAADRAGARASSCCAL